jgi:hypothetical protein
MPQKVLDSDEVRVGIEKLSDKGLLGGERFQFAAFLPIH